MTQMHFEAFAKEISESARSLEERWAMAWLVICVAQRFNPRFNRSRFLDACGLKH